MKQLEMQLFQSLNRDVLRKYVANNKQVRTQSLDVIQEIAVTLKSPMTKYSGSPDNDNRGAPIDDVALAIQKNVSHEISRRSHAENYEPYVVKKSVSPDHEISFFGTQQRKGD